MVDQFVLCAGCSRHVKSEEAVCPFCGEGLSSARPSTGEPFRRMAAAAAVAAGVATVAGCGSPPSLVAYYGSAGIPADSGDDGAADAPSAVRDGAADAPSVVRDGAADAPSVVAFYGIANPMPADAGAGEADGPAVADGSGDASG
jgi:hypothetical protein